MARNSQTSKLLKVIFSPLKDFQGSIEGVIFQNIPLEIQNIQTFLSGQACDNISKVSQLHPSTLL